MLFAAALLLCSCADSIESTDATRSIDAPHVHVPNADRVTMLKFMSLHFDRNNVKDVGLDEETAEIVMTYEDSDVFDFGIDCWCGDCDCSVTFPIDYDSMRHYFDGDQTGTIDWCSECDLFHIHFYGWDYTD